MLVLVPAITVITGNFLKSQLGLSVYTSWGKNLHPETSVQPFETK